MAFIQYKEESWQEKHRVSGFVYSRGGLDPNRQRGKQSNALKSARPPLHKKYRPDEK